MRLRRHPEPRSCIALRPAAVTPQRSTARPPLCVAILPGSEESVRVPPAGTRGPALRRSRPIGFHPLRLRPATRPMRRETRGRPLIRFTFFFLALRHHGRREPMVGNRMAREQIPFRLCEICPGRGWNDSMEEGARTQLHHVRGTGLNPVTPSGVNCAEQGIERRARQGGRVVVRPVHAERGLIPACAMHLEPCALRGVAFGRPPRTALLGGSARALSGTQAVERIFQASSAKVSSRWSHPAPNSMAWAISRKHDPHGPNTGGLRGTRRTTPAHRFAGLMTGRPSRREVLGRGRNSAFYAGVRAAGDAERGGDDALLGPRNGAGSTWPATPGSSGWGAAAAGAGGGWWRWSEDHCWGLALRPGEIRCRRARVVNMIRSPRPTNVAGVNGPGLSCLRREVHCRRTKASRGTHGTQNPVLA